MLDCRIGLIWIVDGLELYKSSCQMLVNIGSLFLLLPFLSLIFLVGVIVAVCYTIK